MNIKPFYYKTVIGVKALSLGKLIDCCKMSVAGLIDHTILKADTTPQEVKQIAKEAIDNKFAAVCIPPYYMREIKPLVEDTPVKLCTVIGFPQGYTSTPAKVEEIKRAIIEGADELDVVVNLCALKSQNWNYLKNDIESVTTAVHLHGKVIKMILETGVLNETEILKLCEFCTAAEVDFVKTSTGYYGGGASVEVVQLLRKAVPASIKIKASGGIRTKTDLMKMVEAGADRIGTSSGIKILAE